MPEWCALRLEIYVELAPVRECSKFHGGIYSLLVYNDDDGYGDDDDDVIVVSSVLLLLLAQSR